MAPKLYGDTRSPCVRAVLLTAKALSIDLEYVAIDVGKGEHLTEWYLKLNPRHTVPTLEDNGLVVYDSHAIMTYLAEKYGNNHPAYPQDIQKRAVINQMLHFETGDIFAIHRYIGEVCFQKGKKEPPKEAVHCLEKGYGFLETFLNNTKYIAGNELTIADFSVWTSLGNSKYFVPVDEKRFPKLSAWIKILNNLPYSNLNEEGSNEFGKFVQMLT